MQNRMQNIRRLLPLHLFHNIMTPAYIIIRQIQRGFDQLGRFELFDLLFDGRGEDGLAWFKRWEWMAVEKLRGDGFDRGGHCDGWLAKCYQSGLCQEARSEVFLVIGFVVKLLVGVVPWPRYKCLYRYSSQ